MRRAGVATVAAAWVADALPSVTAMRWFRVDATPGLSGVGRAGHVALTIDDGPHPASTPRLLHALAAADVHATFFLLGSRLTRWPDLGREIVAAGHEVAVHGWQHRPHLLLPPPAVSRDLVRATNSVREVTGAEPQFWRPPHGILTTTGLITAAALRLTPVLWTADGRDWRADATAAGVARRIGGQLASGGALLLHDAAGSDEASAAAVGAIATIVEEATCRGWQVGPLSQHGLQQQLLR